MPARLSFRFESLLVQTRLLGDLASAVVGARRVIVAIARAPKLEQSVTQGVLVPSIPIVETISGTCLRRKRKM